MSEYCKKCEKRTGTVYNDYMVAFCGKCHTMRGQQSDYTGHKQPFECIHCGRSMTEEYIGQAVCAECAGAVSGHDY